MEPIIFYILLYVVLLVGALTVYLVNFSVKKTAKRNERAAEKLVKEELLAHSLLNPYKDGFLNVPSTDRLMLAVQVHSGDDKQNLVFDPSRPVSVGQYSANNIVLRDAHITGKQICIFLASDGKLYLQNTSDAVKAYVKLGAFSKYAVCPGATMAIGSDAKVTIGKSKLMLSAFAYHYNRR